MRIVEGVSGTWFYHLTFDSDLMAACGARTMASSLPVESWGTITHLKERYCKECAKHLPRAAGEAQKGGADA